MMTIRDCLDPEPTYQPASWKGVPFFVDTSDDDFGRRGHLYEYPLSDRTGYKDLGRKARRFKVEGWIIGGDQIAQTLAHASAAESPEPGTLVHPAYGAQRVACVRLTTHLEYYRDRRRTKLSYDFVEANDSMAPFHVSTMRADVLQLGSAAVNAAALGFWEGTPTNIEAATQASVALARLIEPATDEDSFDAASALERGVQPVLTDTGSMVVGLGVVAPRISLGGPIASTSAIYSEFSDVIVPIDHGTMTIRLIHADAMNRLRTYNKQVVELGIGGGYSVETLVIAARLSLVRDYALTSIGTTYATVAAALADLDFVMTVYDEEEEAAAVRCDDKLVSAIREARATTAQSILQANIRLPGLVTSRVNGIWPSVVVAHKLYADGRRYEEVEQYNASMPPFFIGREATIPAPPQQTAVGGRAVYHPPARV
jgi:prophage DNA circulation protein